MDEGEVMAEMFKQEPPLGMVRWWVDDGQGGGWIEFITPEEAERREREGE